jgi:hypothetical protein
MPLALTVTLEKELPEAQKAYAKSPGKALARESDRLDSAARRCGVLAITSMLSESQAALAEQLREQGFDPSKMSLRPERWFSPAEGIKTLQGLTPFVTANLNDFKQPNPILRDLKSAEELLKAANEAGIRFHFTKTVV